VEIFLSSEPALHLRESLRAMALPMIPMTEYTRVRTPVNLALETMAMKRVNGMARAIARVAERRRLRFCCILLSASSGQFENVPIPAAAVIM